MTKFILLISFSYFFITPVFAQDVIIKKDGSVIKAKVWEINANDVKYKQYENPDGPFYITPKLDVKSVKYENGTVDNFYEEQNIRKSRPFGLALNIAGSALTVGLSANWFITPRINAEAGFSISGYHVGGKYFFMAKEYSKWGFYLGANYFYFNFTAGGPVAVGSGVYSPVGAYYISSDGLSLGLELGVMYSNIHSNMILGIAEKEFVFTGMGGIKLGYHFKRHHLNK